MSSVPIFLARMVDVCDARRSVNRAQINGEADLAKSEQDIVRVILAQCPLPILFAYRWLLTNIRVVQRHHVPTRH